MNEEETHECTACCPTCYACIFDMVDQQKEWIGLTDEEIWEAFMESPVELDCSADELYFISRIIEAKLKDKNT